MSPAPAVAATRPRRPRAGLRCSAIRLMARAGTSEGSQSRVPLSVNGVESSPGGALVGARAAPGVAGVEQPGWTIGRRPSRGREGKPGGRREGVEGGADPPDPAVRVLDPEAPKSLNQPTSSGGRRGRKPGRGGRFEARRPTPPRAPWVKSPSAAAGSRWSGSGRSRASRSRSPASPAGPRRGSARSGRFGARRGGRSVQVADRRDRVVGGARGRRGRTARGDRRPALRRRPAGRGRRGWPGG